MILKKKYGFWFLPAWTENKPYSPDRVKFPSGERIDAKKLIPDSLADLYYWLIRELDEGERYRDYYFSFLNGKDMNQIAEKNYPPQYCLL